MPTHANHPILTRLHNSDELQSSVVRLLAWVMMASVLIIGRWRELFPFAWEDFILFFGIHLAWFIGLLLHTIWTPQANPRRQLHAALADVSGTSFCIYLSGNPFSPFFLIYLWSFVSQGTRYGTHNLLFSCAASVIGYSLVVILMDGWSQHFLYTLFLLVGLIILPLYQFMLLRRLHFSRQTAEAASRARGNFLAVMTHELRTPLSSIIGLSRLLGATRLNREQRGYISSISSSADTLAALIGDILDFSKIDANKLELHPSAFDLRSCVIDVCSGLGTSAASKGVELVCRIDANVPNEILADELRFRQILYNLIGNAVKFTPSGHITVTLTLHNDEQHYLQLEVQDTGIGIDKEKRNRIFDEFWQSDSSRTREYRGTGLGTTIARDLTKMMGGEIGFGSETSRGSCFWLKLPCLREIPDDPPGPPEALQGVTVAISEPSPESRNVLVDYCCQAGIQVILLDHYDNRQIDPDSGFNGNPVDLLLVAESPATDDTQERAERLLNYLGKSAPVLFLTFTHAISSDNHNLNLRKPINPVDLWHAIEQLIDDQPLDEDSKFALESGFVPLLEATRETHVLVAEDDSISFQLINTMLTKAGYRVKRAQDGKQALDLSRSSGFDLALVDVRMPHMDGIEFTRIYRSREKPGTRLPIIALSANTAEEVKQECLDAGMDAYLLKPVDTEKLNALLRHFLIDTAKKVALQRPRNQ
ncbi:ATP-binding protein [Candidatus Endoriftia persephone]|uniref:histidine kinase n=2 Tax=Gammaproteobacteria TaxID=1236 RepID=G2DH96_9GAMM|nr:ATP-binding protein [Candidatus Endoriftia persephone]EGV50008.1 signal transduction histidine-protein kinase BarA [endosymbiont of Riftia pachyptila (vent Ph05)]USF88329.1 ATP-binding protein [Candidatus Endoriftia persephone]